MNATDRAWTDLVGRCCWGVSWERQLGLSMSFGEPALAVREPYESGSSSARLRRLASYRDVAVRGAWWFWALCGRWRLSLRDEGPVTPAASGRRIAEALALLTGQRLARAAVEPGTGATRLEFDLGGVLEVRGSVCDDGALWSLYRPSGYVLSVRTDGQYSHERGTHDSRWRPMQGRSRPVA